MIQEYSFSSSEIESQIAGLSEKGITEFSIHDDEIAVNKRRVLKILNLFAEYAPEVFLSIRVSASVIDKEIAVTATQIYCSFDIPLECTQKGGKLLFDKKFYSNKARLLNDFGLVFGFQLTYALTDGDSFKSFTERLDFAVQQYPNHLDFPQIEKGMDDFEPKVTGLFSAKDIRSCRNLAFSCKTFYTCGRAVPWFLSVLNPLRLYPSKFFADFAEWQICNNCDFKSGFIPEAETHKSIEKMQLLFLQEKYEEKSRFELIPLVKDLVTINGAMSRLVAENEESVIKTSYNPDDLLSEEAVDLTGFVEYVCMEECTVKIFAGEEGPDYQVLN